MPENLFPLILMLIGVGGLLCAATVWLMAWSLIHPPRMTDGKATWVLRRLSPADLGLEFEDLRFQARDAHGGAPALTLAAWWIPNSHAAGRCAVLVHGYADAKVGAIAWAPIWHALGFNLLVPDLRAHGESGGKVCTAGFLEQHDLIQVIDEIRARRPDRTRRLVLIGVSMGAAVSAAAAAHTANIAAVVMDSPYADFRSAALAHMDRLGLPGRPLQHMAVSLAQWLTHADYSAVRPPDLIPRLSCPVLVIEAAEDSFLSSEDRALLAQAIAAHKGRGIASELWAAHGAEHLRAIQADPDGYRSKLRTFLESVLQPHRQH